MQFLILTSFTYLIIFDVDKKKFTKKSKANRLIKSIKMPIFNGQRGLAIKGVDS